MARTPADKTKGAVRTPSAKKSQKKSSAKKSPKRPFGDIRKKNIERVFRNIKMAIKDTEMKTGDNIVPKILAICKLNFTVLKDLLKNVAKSHMSNNLAEELMFQSMFFQQEGKALLRKVLIKKHSREKATTNDNVKVEYLQHMYTTEVTEYTRDNFFTELVPEVTREYKRNPTQKVKNPTQKITTLEVKIDENKKSIHGIEKTIEKKTLQVATAKKSYFRAVNTYRKEFPIEDSEVEEPREYEKLVDENTQVERAKWKELKRSLEAKEKEHETFCQKLKSFEQDLIKIEALDLNAESDEEEEESEHFSDDEEDNFNTPMEDTEPNDLPDDVSIE